MTARIGVSIAARDVQGVIDGILQAEKAGVPNVWLTSGIAGDPMTVIAAVAGRTERVRFGTSIVQTWPRHPITLALQAAVIETIAPGRLRLGIGQSHRPSIESTFGFEWRAPHTHLREYVTITKALLNEGAVDFDGKFYHAHTRLPAPSPMPVMISALREKGFHLAGEIADGAISWVCPPNHLRNVALPAMRAGAAEASRPVPPLIAHAPVCVHENADEVRAAAREQLSRYGTIPYYRAMFADAGFAIGEGGLSDGLIDELVIWGDEARVAERLRGLLTMGAGEVLATPVVAGPDRAASIERTLRLLAEVTKA